MKTASISATKNQLSALIEQVRHGETILSTVPPAVFDAIQELCAGGTTRS